jgi:hypothetical protein
MVYLHLPLHCCPPAPERLGDLRIHPAGSWFDRNEWFHSLRESNHQHIDLAG